MEGFLVFIGVAGFTMLFLALLSGLINRLARFMVTLFGGTRYEQHQHLHFHSGGLPGDPTAPSEWDDAAAGYPRTNAKMDFIEGKAKRT